MLFMLGAVSGVFERLSDWLLTREQTGGVFALLGLVAVGAAVFSVLRWRQSEVETRKRIEAERSYRLLVEQAPVVIYAWGQTLPTADVSPMFVSPQIETLLGYSADEWTADPELRIQRLHPDDRDDVVARFDETNRTGGEFHMEYRILHREGLGFGLPPLVLRVDTRELRAE